VGKDEEASKELAESNASRPERTSLILRIRGSDRDLVCSLSIIDVFSLGMFPTAKLNSVIKSIPPEKASGALH
jgi:hypothetical protein